MSASPPLQTASPPRNGLSSAVQRNVTSVGSGESTLNATVIGTFEPGATTPSIADSVEPKGLSAGPFSTTARSTEITSHKTRSTVISTGD